MIFSFRLSQTMIQADVIIRLPNSGAVPKDTAFVYYIIEKKRDQVIFIKNL